MTRANVTGAILAGGAATRLDGLDKGLQALGGRPLVAWVLEVLRTQVDQCLIVANRNLDAYSHYATTITDLVPGFRGPLAGVAAALAACETTWLLTVPVDCPQPPIDLAARLLRAAHESAVDAVAAHDGERRQPLFAIYRRELAQSAARAAEAGQGVWQWQESIGAHALDFADQRQQFRNLNTPEDFVAYAAEHRLET